MPRATRGPGPAGSGGPTTEPASEHDPRSTEPYGSIIERFRDTEWGTPRTPPPKPAQPFTGLFVIGGVVALLIVSAVVLAGVLSRPPAPTQPPPSRPFLTPPPTPGPEELLMAAFWRQIQGPTLDYHAAIQATATQDKVQVDQSLSLDVYADDFSGTAVLEVKPLLKPTQVVLLRSDGILYTRLRTEKQWTNAVTADQIELRARPFLSLEDPRQLVYGGTVVRAGTALQRLVSTDAYRPSLGTIVPMIEGSLPAATVSLELLVTADGTPVEATFTAHVPADVANGEAAIDLTTTYTFTNVGQVGPIPTPNL